MHNSRHKQCPRQLTDFVEGHNVTALDVLIGRFSAEMILYQTVDRNKVIHNGHHNLHLLDAISNCNKFCYKGWDLKFRKKTNLTRHEKFCQHLAFLCKVEYSGSKEWHTCTPEQSLHLHTPNSFLQLLHVSFIVHGFTSRRTDDFPAKIRKGHSQQQNFSDHIT